MPVADSYRCSQLATQLISNNVQLGSPGYRHKARSLSSVRGDFSFVYLFFYCEDAISF